MPRSKISPARSASAERRAPEPPVTLRAPKREGSEHRTERPLRSSRVSALALMRQSRPPTRRPPRAKRHTLSARVALVSARMRKLAISCPCPHSARSSDVPNKPHGSTCTEGIHCQLSLTCTRLHRRTRGCTCTHLLPHSLSAPSTSHLHPCIEPGHHPFRRSRAM